MFRMMDKRDRSNLSNASSLFERKQGADRRIKSALGIANEWRRRQRALLGHHSLMPCFLSHKEVLVHAGGRLLLLFIIPLK